ncbi:hypothetical protein B0T18DRAFT_394594 [Schizothecium vesticola]|uniref:Uncharacterized protein n=1 Tax=Schizothecium vesticola TaxID=314040 RepID=A0AA40EHI4_9PEZI|nr:hypothetical protein B0T18DRAFT_394594 [Schizothecium vesticola]
MQLQVSPSVLWGDGNSDSKSDASNRDNSRKWANKLISLINRVIEKGLANPINFRRSINKVIEELLEDVKSDDWCCLGIDVPDFEAIERYLAGYEETTDSLDMLMEHDTKSCRPGPSQCHGTSTKRDIYAEHATIPLYLQGMTIRVDWPTYTIRPALTRAQERRLEETSPDMEMAKLHMLGQRMMFACARLNDWVQNMDAVRQVLPLHLYLAGTVEPDNPTYFGYNVTRKMMTGYKAWREDPHRYLECIRPSDVVEEDEHSSSDPNLWEED